MVEGREDFLHLTRCIWRWCDSLGEGGEADNAEKKGQDGAFVHDVSFCQFAAEEAEVGQV